MLQMQTGCYAQAPSASFLSGSVRTFLQDENSVRTFLQDEGSVRTFLQDEGSAYPLMLAASEVLGPELAALGVALSKKL